MPYSRTALTACFVAFAAAQLIALQPARAMIIIVPDDDLSPVDSDGAVHIRREPFKPVSAMGFQATVPDFATGGYETILDATYTWTLTPTRAGHDYIDPSGVTTEDTTYFTAEGRSNGTTKQFTLTCRVQGITEDGDPFDETGSISIEVTWSNIIVTSIEIIPAVNDPTRWDHLSGYGQTFDQLIHGKSLNQCWSRQLIEVNGTVVDQITGSPILPTPWPPPTMNTGPAPAGVFGWVQDWVWGPLPRLFSPYTLSFNPDIHNSGALPGGTPANIYGVMYNSCDLATRTVLAQLQVSLANDTSHTPIAVHYWGYGWDNWNGRWLSTDTPHATVGWIAGGPHWTQVGGEFTDGPGLSGPLPPPTYVP